MVKHPAGPETLGMQLMVFDTFVNDTQLMIPSLLRIKIYFQTFSLYYLVKLNNAYDTSLVNTQKVTSYHL